MISFISHLTGERRHVHQSGPAHKSCKGGGTRSCMLFAAAVTAIAVLVGGCSSPRAEQAGQAGYTEFTDSLGRTVIVPEHVTRVAVTGPVAFMYVFAQAPDMLVGMPGSFESDAEGILDSSWLELPVLGQFYGKNDINLEELLAARPQVIVDVGQLKDSSLSDIEGITERTGLPAVMIEAGFDTATQTFDMLGRLLGKEEEAKELGAMAEDILTACTDIIEKGRGERPGIVYLTGIDGLSVIARDSYHSGLIDMIGDNLAVLESPSSKGTGNRISLEQLLLWDPDVIMLAPETDMDGLLENPAARSLKAVRNGRVYTVPSLLYNWFGFPPSLQRYAGLMWACDILYPDVSDLDLNAMIGEFYSRFFHAELTDEELRALTGKK